MGYSYVCEKSRSDIFFSCHAKLLCKFIRHFTLILKAFRFHIISEKDFTYYLKAKRFGTRLPVFELHFQKKDLLERALVVIVIVSVFD